MSGPAAPGGQPAPLTGAAPYLQARVMPVGSYIIATEPLSPELAASISPRDRTFFDSKAFLYYWHINAERRLIFGGRASFWRTNVDRTAAILQRAMHQVHPQTAGLRIDFAWGGNVAFTFDRLPHLGEHEGIHHALGYCGSGIALGTTFGLEMARRIAAGQAGGSHDQRDVFLGHLPELSIRGSAPAAVHRHTG